jgi:hypothetical protein
MWQKVPTAQGANGNIGVLESTLAAPSGAPFNRYAGEVPLN